MLQRALAVSAQYSVLEVPTKKRKGRFSLLQLEHGLARERARLFLALRL